MAFRRYWKLQSPSVDRYGLAGKGFKEEPRQGVATALEPFLFGTVVGEGSPARWKLKEAAN